MTTDDEIREALREPFSTPEGIESFRSDFGGGDWNTLDQLIARVNQKQEIKDRLCRRFGILTDQEKVTKTTIDSARAGRDAADAAIQSAQQAKEANDHAREANRIAEKANRLSQAALGIAVLAMLASAAAVVVPFLVKDKQQPSPPAQSPASPQPPAPSP